MVKTISVFKVVLFEDVGLSFKSQPPRRVLTYMFQLSVTASNSHAQRDMTPALPSPRFCGHMDRLSWTVGLGVSQAPVVRWELGLESSPAMRSLHIQDGAPTRLTVDAGH